MSICFIYISIYFVLTNRFYMLQYKYGGDIMFSYKPLLKLLIERDMTKTQLREATGMSMNTLAKISKNEYISMATLDNICSYLHCNIEDVIEFIE